jgi:hypothetical protein
MAQDRSYRPRLPDTKRNESAEAGKHGCGVNLPVAREPVHDIKFAFHYGWQRIPVYLPT